MNSLLSTNNDSQLVSARELYKKLDVTDRFNRWFERMIVYGFEDGVDFTSVKTSTVVNNGAEKPINDYEISIDMAKHICMVQRTEKAKQVRQYLIDLEKVWNSPEQVMARALKLADKKIKSLQVTIEEQKPKVEFFDTVAESKTAISMNEVAKVIDMNGYGRNKLFEFLRQAGVLMKNNVPYQRYVDNGWFRVIEQSYQKNGEPVVTTKTLVYQKGVDGIRKLLIKYVGEENGETNNTETSYC